MTKTISNIKKYLICKSGRINPNLYKHSWWERRNLSWLQEKIFDDTKILNDNYSISERIHYILKGYPNLICKCGREIHYSPPRQRFNYSCSIKCSLNGAVLNKRRKTNLKRYGHIHHLQNSLILEKQKQTNLKRYGKENISQSKNNLCKIKTTNLKRYGVEHHNQKHIPKDVLEKLNDKQWLIEQHYNQKKSMIQIADELGEFYITDSTLGRYFKGHDIIVKKTRQTSYKETQLFEYIKSIYSGKIITNDRTQIKPYELDVFLPDLNIAFEYNGTYWHQEGINKPIGYHDMKTNLCKNKNITLYHIWEGEDYEWIEKICN